MTGNNNNQEISERTKRVLSIQSHVVHGYVGNKAATFPLQYQGWEVDALNTVQFSNHPGYQFFTGYSSSPNELVDIISKGLIDESELSYDAILTGYISDVEGLRKIGDLISQLCKDSKKIKWLLDPVLGDNGKLYVSEENIKIYQEILRTASIYVVTPNQFEMEVLTNVKITDLPSLRVAFEVFREHYPTIQNVVVTSVELPEHPDVLTSACSTFNNADKNKLYIDIFEVPIIPAKFSGSGDLFSAILLNNLFSYKPVPKNEGELLKSALHRTLIQEDAILKRTYELTLKEFNHTQTIDNLSIVKDLKLIQSKDLLVDESLYSNVSFKCSSI
ncbi:hypothetical protein TPHA_0M01790 [Tetrapisispora phaffii CBS 4417]|uniref:pyridoxal kinase n=1 Tax=Tetrapisispora phaffii (strain ATCC 24235 / CBS 4417 / NBRC 1672 / NRRL Y-8282 / UCD 70-5) TaxID=1071381 RepID=G8C0N9_TETPH|nr:hypothetical protein TPHA_0M01790 [Tetrapisispora phaffii CBS 4417]CCE65754.1 hypothetical protein TPHA_0M01790 [Tetrapisispora phaffii CBS 4417]